MTPASGNAAPAVVSAVRRLFSVPRRSSTILVLVGALIVAVGCWYFGTDVWHAVIFGAALGAAGVVWVAVPDVREVLWRDDAGSSRDGTRSDVVHLSWSLHARYGRVSHAGLRRVQELARRRLALRHLNLLDPADRAAIEQLIGGPAYVMLRSNERRPPPLRSIVRCLDMLDVLDPARSAAQAPLKENAG